MIRILDTILPNIKTLPSYFQIYNLKAQPFHRKIMWHRKRDRQVLNSNKPGFYNFHKLRALGQVSKSPPNTCFLSSKVVMINLTFGLFCKNQLIACTYISSTTCWTHYARKHVLSFSASPSYKCKFRQNF